MLQFLRHILLAIHFLIASCINLAVGLARPRNPDNSRLCGRVCSLLALRILGLQTRLDVD